MRLVSLNVGRARWLDGVRTAIHKRPVSGRVWLGPEGLEGDEQADRRHHGGPDQVVCVHPLEHYAYWRERLLRPLYPGEMGENFTTAGLLEDEVVVGEVWRVGTARLQVSGPRAPCGKPGKLHGEPRLGAWMEATGYTGWYLRLLEPGWVWAGCFVERLEVPAHGVTVAEVVRVAYRDREDAAARAHIARFPELAASWRARLEDGG